MKRSRGTTRIPQVLFLTVMAIVNTLLALPDWWGPVMAGGGAGDKARQQLSAARGRHEACACPGCTVQYGSCLSRLQLRHTAVASVHAGCAHTRCLSLLLCAALHHILLTRLWCCGAMFASNPLYPTHAYTALVSTYLPPRP